VDTMAWMRKRPHGLTGRRKKPIGLIQRWPEMTNCLENANTKKVLVRRCLKKFGVGDQAGVAVIGVILKEVKQTL